MMHLCWLPAGILALLLNDQPSAQQDTAADPVATVSSCPEECDHHPNQAGEGCCSGQWFPCIFELCEILYGSNPSCHPCQALDSCDGCAAACQAAGHGCPRQDPVTELMIHCRKLCQPGTQADCCPEVDCYEADCTEVCPEQQAVQAQAAAHIAEAIRGCLQEHSCTCQGGCPLLQLISLASQVSQACSGERCCCSQAENNDCCECWAGCKPAGKTTCGTCCSSNGQCCNGQSCAASCGNCKKGQGQAQAGLQTHNSLPPIVIIINCAPPQAPAQVPVQVQLPVPAPPVPPISFRPGAGTLPFTVERCASWFGPANAPSPNQVLMPFLPPPVPPPVPAAHSTPYQLIPVYYPPEYPQYYPQYRPR